MAKTVTIDEIHLTLRIPNDLPDVPAEAILAILTGDDFMTRLRRAVRVVLRQFSELRPVRGSLTR
jgi:hypothetical protein